MKINELEHHITDFKNFKLKWRFTENQYDIIPENHLKKIKPLDNSGSKYLSDFIEINQIHSQFPFKKDIFCTVDKIRIKENNENEITKWLYKRGLSLEKKVYLSWDNETAIITNWEFVVKYWNSLFYKGSDDLTIIDQSLLWTILFFHENEIYFGTKTNFKIEKQTEKDFKL